MIISMVDKDSMMHDDMDSRCVQLFELCFLQRIIHKAHAFDIQVQDISRGL